MPFPRGPESLGGARRGAVRPQTKWRRGFYFYPTRRLAVQRKSLLYGNLTVTLAGPTFKNRSVHTIAIKFPYSADQDRQPINFDYSYLILMSNHTEMFDNVEMDKNAEIHLPF